MRSAAEWFEAYGESHKNRINILIHKVCVPLILWSIIAMLWTIPVPEIFLDYGLNWAHVLMLLALGFYLNLRSMKVIIVMLLQFTLLTFLTDFIHSRVSHRLLYIAFVVFILAWIGQFIGHKIEGKKPSFFQDLQFLLIGPIWVFKSLFKI